MPTSKAGKRSAKFTARIVEDGSQIHMFIEGYDASVINFNRGTGASGREAYQKLQKVLDDAAARKDGNP